VLARFRPAWGGAWSAVIMAGRVIPEDRAGGHAPGMPGSRSSSWSWNIARVTARPLPARPARPGTLRSPGPPRGRRSGWPGASAG